MTNQELFDKWWASTDSCGVRGVYVQRAFLAGVEAAGVNQNEWDAGYAVGVSAERRLIKSKILDAACTAFRDGNDAHAQLLRALAKNIFAEIA